MMTENIHTFEVCWFNSSTQTRGVIQHLALPECIAHRNRPGLLAQLLRHGGGWKRGLSWLLSMRVFMVALAAASTAFGQNLVQNPGFEQGTAYWGVHDGQATLTTTTAFPHSGLSAGLAYNRTGKYGGPQQSLLGRMQPEVAYFCSAWVRLQNGNAQTVKMTFRWQDNSPDDHYSNVVDRVAFSSSWIELSGVFGFSSNGPLTELVLFFEDPPVSVDLLVDDVIVAPVRTPVVELSFPTNGTRWSSESNLLLNATPTVSYGLTVASVEFYESGRLLGRRTNAPYSLVSSNVPAGTYCMTAKVTDSLGQSTVSAPANVVVVSESTPLTFFPDFSVTNGLWLQGESQITSNRLRLTTAHSNRVGAAWLSARQMVRNGFEATFQFQITATNSGGGEGLAFVLQNHDLPLLGGGGSGLGYEGLSNSLAIEFDIRRNSGNADPSGKHISVHCLGTDANTAFEGISMGWTDEIPDFSDGKVHAVTIRYEPGKLMAFADNPADPVLSLGLDLDNALKLDQGMAWVGFTASTSDSYENHDLLMFSFWPDLGPSIQLNAPLEQDVFLAPATIPVLAQSGDIDGQWVWVDFYVDDYYLGSASSPPFGLTWTNVQAGQYQLRAEAIDEFGTTSESNPVNITVEEAPHISRIWGAPGDAWILELNTVPGRSYAVQSSGNLTNWQTTGIVIGAGGLQQWTDPEPRGRARFYRLLLQP